MLTKRSEAIAAGDDYYFTGKPCKRGMLRKGMCVLGATSALKRLKNHIENGKLFLGPLKMQNGGKKIKTE